jgi:BirA family biotin operon repressor/biotin-[acetyl-CoA-carboxylase] ligase
MSEDRPLDEWEGHPLEHWSERWQLPRVVAWDRTPSTNDVARRMALDGAAAGTLVLSEHQTEGRGRLRRAWSDEPGLSLLLSFILRPAPLPGDGATSPGAVPLRVGMATVAALRAAAAVPAQLKWPNDVVVDGRGKLAGILCEAVSHGAAVVIIAGIGINVGQDTADWPPDLRGRATSVAQLRGPGAADRAAILGRLAISLRPLFHASLTPLSGEEIGAFAALDALAGQNVIVTDPVGPSGMAAGIDSDGALLISTGDGMRRVSAGTVRIASLSPSAYPGSP